MSDVALEALIASWLTRRGTSDDVDLEEICRAHPQHAEELRRVRLVLELLGKEESKRQSSLASSFSERIRCVHGPGVDPMIRLEGEEGSDHTDRLIDQLSGRMPSSGRYHLKGEIGRGGMGAVLRVWDEDLRRHLAMKVLLENGGAGTQGEKSPVDKRLLARFLEEAQVTSQLDHPGIVPVHELGLDADGKVFFTMKLVKGLTLDEVFDGARAAGECGWTQIRVLGLFVRICEALSYAHAKRVIHRDLKPANVMVGRFGEVYVMDWGLARVLGREDEKDLRARPPERSGRVPPPTAATGLIWPRTHRSTRWTGTSWALRATCRRSKQRDAMPRSAPSSDVYAVGAMLYHLLAGQVPYAPTDVRLDPRTVLLRIQEGPPRALRELAPKAPGELVAICERAMEREPAARYTDMASTCEGPHIVPRRPSRWGV